MPTDGERAKITAAIAELENKQTVLRAKLKEVQDFNAAAWAEYGSELCGGEMAGNERKISGEIAANQKTIDLLNDYLAGDFSLSDEKRIRNVIDYCVQQIKHLESEKSAFEAHLEAISLIKSFL